jgi:2-succinyl-6-hydroxy-2,4-cyclohexadiene-1-carboxylate synthase
MITVWFIHGNLQQGSVWKPIQEYLKKYKSTYFSDEITFIIEDLWQSNVLGLDDWATQFCAKAEKKVNSGTLFLVGYSLGGRLALHALLKNSTLWSGAIIIGADTGFSTEKERYLQSLHDAQWARYFLSDPWDELLAAWDNHGVFCQIPCSVERKENDFSREKISKALFLFSKAKQLDLLPYFKKLDHPPILFLSGEIDKRYTAIGKKFAADCPIVSHQIITFAGHRVPWENTLDFTNSLLHFIGQQIVEKRW